MRDHLLNAKQILKPLDSAGWATKGLVELTEILDVLLQMSDWFQEGAALNWFAVSTKLGRDMQRLGTWAQKFVFHVRKGRLNMEELQKVLKAAENLYDKLQEGQKKNGFWWVWNIRTIVSRWETFRQAALNYGNANF